MDVEELLGLTDWVETELKARQMINRYATLTGLLQHNANQSQPTQPFASQADSLYESLRKVDLTVLNDQQLEFLATLGILRSVGEAAVETIENILFRNALDIATANARIQALQESLQSGIARSDQIRASLLDLVPRKDQIIQEEVIVRVRFAAGASITNVVNLKKWSSEWFDIGRGLAIANDRTPEELRVVGARQGSIIIELAVGYAIAKTISKILLECLSVADKVLDIQKKAAEIEALNLGNQRFTIELKLAAEEFRKKSIEQISLAVPGVVGDAGNGEKLTIVEKGVKKLISFLEKGGQVDCVVPPELVEGDEGQESADLSALRENFRTIRVLESRRRLIGYNAANDEDGAV